MYKGGIVMSKNYEGLKLENQLCFPLYACAKEIVRKYKPFLDELDLTYTQYIAMMVLWEKKQMNVKELGESLYLDSGTLTPLLKKLEGKVGVESMAQLIQHGLTFRLSELVSKNKRKYIRISFFPN